ncbi:MAG: tRNA (guanosine(37)-N1)-methyltransferase TrmD [Candidatus Latescibacterota bacterium]|nr:MAG: tRNA (guanosine(37)-N1)-methyltransferase TrmD [Candidatus Latescibacterota bacterium]
MRFYVVTIFPELFPGPLAEGVTGKALASGRAEVLPVPLRDFTLDKHLTTDDTPYGGGPGMVMKPEPLFRAVEWVRETEGRRIPVVLLTPKGEPLRQEKVRALAGQEAWILVCGRYRGVDERFRETLVDLEISVGDFVLSGGEIPALALMDAVIRLLPGVLGNEDSADEDSFSNGTLGPPDYTKPPEFRGLKVPDVLLSGDHAKIAAWRRERALEATRRRRPDLLDK